ncbi:MAG TPA: aldo/keto reductase [Chitinophagaceae bacterium]|nr:aldo/keto reductase [Chitinophagaceae bacterium]
MEYSILGNTSMNISRIAFGCMSLHPDSADNDKLLMDAVAGGINYFDTADLYNNGLNEEILGRALKTCRAEVFIATKVGNQLRPDGSGWDWNPTKKYILEAAEKSLQRLQTDHIDLYQLHGGTIDDPIDETIEAFEQLKQQGKIRYYGISSIRPNVIREWVKRSGISSVMMQYSLLDRRPEEECLQLLLKNNIGVLARGPLAQGLLVTKPAKDYLGKNADDVKSIAAAMNGQKSPASALALQYVLHHPAITAVVAGIRTNAQLQDALKAIRLPPLTEEMYSWMLQISSPNYYTDHR